MMPSEVQFSIVRGVTLSTCATSFFVNGENGAWDAMGINERVTDVPYSSRSARLAPFAPESLKFPSFTHLPGLPDRVWKG